MIDKDFISEVLSKVDLLEVIPLKLTKKGNDYWGCCPFHNEKTASFSVSVAKGFYHCFGCGAHGDAVDFLMDYEHLDFREAISNLAEMVGMEVPKKESRGSNDNDVPLSEPLTDALKFFKAKVPSDSHSGAPLGAVGYAPSDERALYLALKDKYSDAVLKRAGLIKGSGVAFATDAWIYPIGSHKRIIGLEALNPGKRQRFVTLQDVKGAIYGLDLIHDRLKGVSVGKILLVSNPIIVNYLINLGIPAVCPVGSLMPDSVFFRKLFKASKLIVVPIKKGDSAHGWQFVLNVSGEALSVYEDGLELRFVVMDDWDLSLAEKDQAAFEDKLSKGRSLTQVLQLELEMVQQGKYEGVNDVFKRASNWLNLMPDGMLKQMFEDEVENIAIPF